MSISASLLIAPCDPAAALLTQPALSLWRHTHPKEYLLVLASEKVAAIFALMPEVSEVMSLPQHLFTSTGLLSTLGRLKKRSFAHAFQLCSGRKARALLAYLSIETRHFLALKSSTQRFLGPRSEDYAAVLLGLPSPSEVPIHLPIPSLRPDNRWLRDEQAPIFVISATAAAPTFDDLTQRCKDRWDNASVTFLKNTSPLKMSDRLALIAKATAVVTDDPFIVQLSDAFSTPVVCLDIDLAEIARPWPASRGRVARSGIDSGDILQSIEKVLRFDRQFQLAPKV
jgi:ADP-heptose:LPS heptosyltransferase